MRPGEAELCRWIAERGNIANSGAAAHHVARGLRCADGLCPNRSLIVRHTTTSRPSGTGSGQCERVVLVDNWIEELRARVRK